MEKRNQGITLIALIITIIIMLILVAVSIQVLINSGLFGTAGDATSKMKTAQEDEAKLGEQIEIGGTKYDSMEDFLSGNSSIKLSYKIEGTKLKLTAKCESYEEFVARKLAGKTKEQKEQIFFDSVNYIAKMNGEQTYGSIEEMLTDINKTANPKVESMEDFAIQELGVENLDEALTMEIGEGCGWTYLEERFNFVVSPMLVSMSGEEKVEMQEISKNEYYMEYPVVFAGTYLFRVEKGTDYSSVAINVETGIAKVEPENIDDWEYTVEEDGTITITGYKGNDTEVVIPNYINGVPVTAINPKKGGIGVGENDVSIWDKQICDTSVYTGSGITWATTLITSVRVSEGIKYIENYSFFGTINLQNVVLPQSLIKIGYQAFSNCRQLAYITIPKSVQTMGAYAFSGEDSITINVKWKEGEKPEGWEDYWDSGNVTINYTK